MRLKSIVLMLALGFSGFVLAEDFPVFEEGLITSTQLARSPQDVQVKADKMWKLGATGKGVKVGILDTGIDRTHLALKNNLVGTYNAVTRTTDVTDTMGHGTHVAGIIASNYLTAGISPDAGIVAVKVFDNYGSSNTSYLESGIKYLNTQPVKVINMSLGWNTYVASVEAALKATVAADKLVVVAAGNEGKANPGYPGMFAPNAWANNQIMVVGAVDANNNIASFSNRAGAAMYQYVVAPGVNILSSYKGGQFAYMSGTSMASPVVAGIAANIYSYWPYLKANQVANIIFSTATDLGAKGVDAVYGWGLVNGEKALQPIGTIKSVTAKGTSVLTPLKVAQAQGSALKAANFSVMGYDDFGRGYSVNLSENVQQGNPLHVDQLFSLTDNQFRMVGTTGKNFRFVALNKDVQSTLGYLEKDLVDNGKTVANYYEYGFSGGEKFFGGTANLMAEAFVYGDTPFAGSFGFKPVVAEYAGSKGFMGFSKSIGGTEFKVASTMSSVPYAYSDTLRNVSANMVEVSKNFGDVRASMQWSKLAEVGSYMGVSDGSASGTASYLTANALVDLGNKSYMAATFTQGKMSGGHLGMTDYSESTSQTWALGFAKEGIRSKHDRFLVSVSQPVATKSGSVSLTSATSTAEDGTPIITTQTANLSAPAKETNFYMGYQDALGKNGTWSVAAMRRMNPGNSNLPSENALGAKLNLVF